MNCLHFIKISVENSNPHVFNYEYKHSIAGLIPRIIMDSDTPRCFIQFYCVYVLTYATIEGVIMLFVQMVTSIPLYYTFQVSNIINKVFDDSN